MNPSSRETSGISLPPPAGRSSAKSDDASTTPTTVSPLSDDSDKVEKEWVDKARRIVAQTRGDPYRQSEELTAVKADYMRQRYNKIIKVDK